MNPLSNLNIDDLGRSHKDQQIYEQFKKQILKEFFTIEDYIKINYLQYESILHMNLKKAIKNNKSLEYNLIKNPYPYNIKSNMQSNMQSNIQHYVLFSEKEIPKTEQLKIIKNNLDIENKNFIYFTNAYDKRSIKNLWHLHILIQEM